MWSHASGEHLAGYEQQDAHEFLMALLDGLHSDLLTSPTPTVLPSPRALLVNRR
jgi:ubiquitin C-terminal hydrolase